MAGMQADRRRIAFGKPPQIAGNLGPCGYFSQLLYMGSDYISTVGRHVGVTNWVAGAKHHIRTQLSTQNPITHNLILRWLAPFPGFFTKLAFSIQGHFHGEAKHTNIWTGLSNSNFADQQKQNSSMRSSGLRKWTQGQKAPVLRSSNPVIFHFSFHGTLIRN